jgi:CRP-like cAMP-binding protein
MNTGFKSPLSAGNTRQSIIWPPRLEQKPRQNPVLVRLQSFAQLSAYEIDVLQGLPALGRGHAVQTELCAERRVQSPRFLLAGWACQQRLLGDGRRQIIRFLVPGDVIGSVVDPTTPSNCAVVALTPVTVADARHVLRALDGTQSAQGLTNGLWAMHNAAELGLYNQVVRLGRQTAYERLLHLILEIHSRLNEIGQVDGESFDFPLTQEVLGDALGLSLVHVNRTLQQVRRDRMIELRAGRVTILQPKAVQEIADWDSHKQDDGVSSVHPRGLFDAKQL